MLKIALLAALPEEYEHLRRNTGPWIIQSKRPFRQFRRTMEGKDLILLETGMGKSALCSSMEWIVQQHSPDIIVSFGFAGSFHKDIGVGDVCMAEDIIGYSASKGCFEEDGFHLHSSPQLSYFCSHHNVRNALILTVAQPMPKHSAAKLLNPFPGLTDMESWHAARCAKEKEVPWLCFRAVSDGVEDEIHYDLEEITDTHGRVRLGKVIWAVIKRPLLVRSFYEAWKRSSCAAGNLAKVLEAFLSLPAPAIFELCSKSRMQSINPEKILGF